MEIKKRWKRLLDKAGNIVRLGWHRVKKSDVFPDKPSHGEFGILNLYLIRHGDFIELDPSQTGRDFFSLSGNGFVESPHIWREQTCVGKTYVLERGLYYLRTDALSHRFVAMDGDWLIGFPLN